MDDDEEDSFYRPIPSSKPIQPTIFDSKETKIEDPDSDDSFDTFQPSQFPQPSTIPVFSNLTIQTTQKVIPSTQLNSTNAIKYNVPTLQNKVQNIEAKPKIPNQASTSQKPATPVIIRPVFPKATTSKSRFGSGTANSSFTRHGSDNSFFRAQITAKPNVPKNTPVPVKISPTLISPSSQRPVTPSGEVLMLRGQVENYKKEKAKITAEMQKNLKELTDKHILEVEEQKRKYEQLLKENEILKTTSACRITNQNVPSNTIQQNTSPHHVETRKITPRIPRMNMMNNNGMRPPSVVRPYIGKTGVTPRRTVAFPNQLSAFRHERPIGAESGDDTFLLEESFEPSATSTPRAGHLHKTPSLRRPFDLNSRANGMDDIERGAPLAKKKPDGPPRKKRTKQEILAKSREFYEKIEGSEKYIDMVYDKDEKCAIENKDDSLIGFEKVESEYIDSYLATQLLNLKAEKKRENLTKSMKNKFTDPVYTSPSCSRCHISEMQALPESSGRKKLMKKEWEEVEELNMKREMRKADALNMRMYNEMLQSLTRKGMERLEATKAARTRADQELVEKKKRISKRTLNEIRSEVKEKWRSEIYEELHDKGELHARLQVTKWPSAVENDDYIWTSDSDDENIPFEPSCSSNNFDKWTLCSRCVDKQATERRISKRNNVKTEVIVEALAEYGKEQRELMRNVSILTKSKIEAADRELIREVAALNEMEEDSF